MADSASASLEMESNVLLKAIQPGGILHGCIELGPLKVLCCPRQSFLEASGLLQYLLLPPPPPRSRSSPCSSTSTGASLATLKLHDQSIVLGDKRHQQVAQALCKEFLNYHSLNFNGVASPAFVTARGHRGEFSGNLKSVARYGRIGTSEVLGDLNLTIESENAAVPSNHSGMLHVFIIAGLLMDEEEMHNMFAALKRAASPQVKPSEEKWCVDKARPSLAVSGKSALESRCTREFIAKYRQTVTDTNDVQFHEFQRYMESKVCRPIAMELSSFVETMQQREGLILDNVDVKRIITVCMDLCKSLPLFECDTNKLHILAEGFERYIMTKLYWRAFDVDPEDNERNEQLSRKLRELSSVVTAKQLDAIGSVESHYLWDQAMFDLEGMNFFKSPRDKLLCGVRAYHKLAIAVSDILMTQKKKTCNIDEKGKKNDLSFGATELLPCFMLLVLRGYPRNFYLNVQYVKRFRNADLMTSEEGYCLTNLESAVTFWLSYTESPAVCGKCPVESSTLESFFISENVPQSVSCDKVNGIGNTPLPVVDRLSESPSSVFDPFSLLDLNAKNAAMVGGESGINVEKLLLEDETPFDNLTVAELRAIVNEARRLLREKKRPLYGMKDAPR